jgi:formylglycine-generating enzyme required for sulfatase activity
MEPAADSNGHVDLAILDHSGVVTYVGDPGSTPPQDFMFPETPEFPMGRAVDVEVTPSGQGFFVLTDFGGIYRAGDAKLQEEQSLVPDTDRMGVLGYDILFGALRVPTAANPGGASIRAVALLVLYVNAGVEGYLILDSQGGHYQLLASGQPVPVGTYNGLQQHSPFRLLEPGSGGYSWPFFPGWDIARDMELMPVTGDGLVIFNGWGGIHPVPAFDRTNAVYYLTNRDPAHPGHVLTTVGMPYVVAGFDDPDTPADESDPALFGIDAASIFTDLEFCRTGDGIYTMDKFGAVFAFGSARAMPDSTAPPFTHIPYFFPFLWAQDMEPMEPETMFGQETDFTVDLPNLATDARPLRLVRIPAGTFQMGSPNTERGRYRDWEGPVHTVTLTHDFYIGEAEVTQAQWKALMGSNPATDLGYTPYGVGNDYPVYYVSWDDCQSFITALNALGQGTFRLPTEAEWEYACRARTTTRFYFGDSLECGDENQDCAAGTLPGNRSDYMWYWFNYNTPTFGSKPVHGKMPNAFGLYDMHGNVWEWCQDWFQEDFYSQPGATAPNPLCTDSASGYRVFRGGYWSVDAVYCRSAFRSRYVPGTRVTNIGLRVVRLA